MSKRLIWTIALLPLVACARPAPGPVEPATEGALPDAGLPSSGQPDRPFASGTPLMQQRIREVLAEVPGTTGAKRLALARRLLQYGEPAIPQILDALGHEDASVRTLAAYLLGLHKDPRTLDALSAAQDDADTGVRFEAATALARAGDRRGMPLLVDGLEHRDPRIRSRSIRVLEQATGESFGYKHDDHPADRGAAIARWRSWLTAWAPGGGS